MNTRSRAGSGDNLNACVIKQPGLQIALKPPFFTFDFEQIRDGVVIDRWQSRNQVTSEGAKDILDKYFANGTVPASWYVGLISGTSYTTAPAIGNTAASLSGTGNGWTECSATYAPNYDTPAATARGGPISWGAASGTDLVSKAASAAIDFTMSATGTVKGAFIVSTGTRLGTTGVLYCASLFGDKSVNDNDIVRVSVTVQQDLSYTP
jgi:hypothetical protein